MWMLSVCMAFAATQPLDAFWADFAQKRDQVVVLEAKFTQTNTSVDEEEVSKGTLVYAKPRRIVFSYETPEKSVCLIDGLRVYEYDVEFKQVQIFNLEDDAETEALYLGFESDIARLTKAYDVEMMEPGDAFPNTKCIVLKPKPREDNSAPLFERVHLYLRDKDYLPVRIYIVNDEDSSVDIEIKDIAVNKPLEPAATQLDLPEGVRIIEDDVFVEQVGPEGKRTPDSVVPKLPASEAKPAEEPKKP